MMEGIWRFIRLAIDPKSARDLESDAREALDKGTDPKTPKRNLSAVESAMDRVKKAAIALGAAILSAFSIRAIGNFMRSSIDASFELEASRNRLAQALRNEGIELSRVNNQLQQFTRNLWETHRLTEGEVNPVLQTLVTVTGDYELSLRGVGIAADLAAAANMDVTSAARLVGRVMRGETTALRRYGIVIEDGADAVQVLEDRLRGMALAATPATVSLTKAFGDLKEEIGFALREATDFDAKVQSLSDLVIRLKDNKELLIRTTRQLIRALRDLVTVVAVLSGVKGLMALRAAALAAGGGINFLIARLQALSAAMGPAGWITLAISSVIIAFNRMRDAAADAARAAQEAAEAFQHFLDTASAAEFRMEQERIIRQIGLLQRELDQLAGPMEGAFVPQTKRAAELNEQIQALRDQYQQLQQVIDRTPDEVPAVSAPGEPGEPRPTIGGVQLPGLLGIGRARLDAEQHAAFVQSLTVITTEAANAQAAAAAEAADRALEAMRQNAESAAMNMTDAFAGFFEGMAQGFMGMMSLADAFRQGVSGIGGAIVEELTKGKAEYHMAEGAGALASGTWPPNPLAIKAAAQHFLAAGLFRALPGVVRSMGRGGSGGRTSIPSPTRSMLPTAQFQAQAPEINIYIDPLNPSNPAWQSNLAQTLRGVTQRYGSTNVNVRPRTA
jgi:hypothetical protein